MLGRTRSKSGFLISLLGETYGPSLELGMLSCGRATTSEGLEKANRAKQRKSRQELPFLRSVLFRSGFLVFSVRVFGLIRRAYARLSILCSVPPTLGLGVLRAISLFYSLSPLQYSKVLRELLKSLLLLLFCICSKAKPTRRFFCNFCGFSGQSPLSSHHDWEVGVVEVQTTQRARERARPKHLSVSVCS